MIYLKNFMIMDEAGEGKGAGGGTSDQGGDAGKGAADSAALAKENAELKERLAKFESSASRPDSSPDLIEKSRLEREAADKKNSDLKSIESAIRFSLTADSFMEKHGALLPESVKDVFKTADKESYDSPIQKASEIKSCLIAEFFAVQENMDFLTPAQKGNLADWQKLTKDGRRDKASMIYDNIFEPALEMLKTIKKAEQVQKTRNGYGDDSDAAYKAKLMGHSRQHYLGEKQNA